MNFIVDTIVGVLISALAGIGVGGGGLMTLYLTLVRDVPQLEAQGINLLMFAATTAAASVINLRYRNIDVGLLMTSFVPVAVGSLIGSGLSLVTDPGVLRVFLGVLLALAGIITLIPKDKRA